MRVSINAPKRHSSQRAWGFNSITTMQSVHRDMWYQTTSFIICQNIPTFWTLHPVSCCVIFWIWYSFKRTRRFQTLGRHCKLRGHRLKLAAMFSPPIRCHLCNKTLRTIQHDIKLRITEQAGHKNAGGSTCSEGVVDVLSVPDIGFERVWRVNMNCKNFVRFGRTGFWRVLYRWAKQVLNSLHYTTFNYT
jgi:hypothetical protein